jgi:pimeloyl-ACP methyl ester carboxylesterase
MSKTRLAGLEGVLAVDDGGRGGLPVILAHSLAGHSGHWQAQLDHLRPKRRAIAFDFRGHGESDPPRNRDYSIAGMSDDISAVANALGLERFLLVGHSMGSGAALVYAASHPERVAGLLLLDPLGDATQFPRGEAQAFLSGFETNYDTASESYWTTIAGPNSAVEDRLLADLKSTSRDTVVPVLRSVMEFDPRPALARYAGPKLAVVTPYNDQAFSLHRVGAGFPHRVITGTGHWIQLDKPAEFNQIMDEFLNREP